jgi:hypothetical protein
MEPTKFVQDLELQEPEAILRTLAMMSYNPAIGRVLEEGGVGRFQDLMVASVPLLANLTDRPGFDAFHADTCAQIRSALKTNRGEPLSYGQAQKPLNVFLKVYVAWAKLPDAATAGTLQHHLHVPLDSVVMRFVKDAFPEEFRRCVAERCAGLITNLAAEHPELSKRRISGLLVENTALASMSAPVYFAWQELLRILCPDRPILLDTIWAMERSRATSV